MAKSMSKATVTVYRDEGGRWRWRLRVGNGKNFAASNESFASRGNARRAADRMRELIATGAFVDVIVEEAGGG